MNGDKTSKHFWERTGTTTLYPRMKQSHDTCVFLSVAAAINHLCKRTIWDEASLFHAFQQQGGGGVNFSSVMNVAEQPIATEIEWKDHVDSPGNPALGIEEVAKWVRNGGIVIASLELAQPDGGSLKRAGRWHMFTLIAEDGDFFEVWDTNGLGGFVSKVELETGIEYPNGLWFIVHDRRNMLLIRNQPLAPQPSTPPSGDGGGGSE